MGDNQGEQDKCCNIPKQYSNEYISHNAYQRWDAMNDQVEFVPHSHVKTILHPFFMCQEERRV